MEKIEEYLGRAKDLAEDAGDMARKFAGEVAGKAKELTEEHGKVKELAQNAREQSATLALGARRKFRERSRMSWRAKRSGRGSANLRTCRNSKVPYYIRWNSNR